MQKTHYTLRKSQHTVSAPAQGCMPRLALTPLLNDRRQNRNLTNTTDQLIVVCLLVTGYTTRPIRMCL
jgi:hypothetical protein